MNNLVKVFETSMIAMPGVEDLFEASAKEKLWLEEILDDNSIPYKTEIVPYWVGVQYAKYHEKKCIYVDKIYEQTVLAYIAEYNNPYNVIEKYIETFESAENALPQVECAQCGEKYDIDYPKCPYCSRTK